MIDEGRRFGAFGAVPYKVLTAPVRGLDRKIKEVYIIERKLKVAAAPAGGVSTYELLNRRSYITIWRQKRTSSQIE